MSVKLVKFERSHLSIFSLQDKQMGVKSHLLDSEYVDSLCNNFYSLFYNNQVIAIGGLIPEGNETAQASILLSNNLGHKFIHVHRQTKKFFYSSNYRRIYMRCHVDFSESICWANKLGFEFEGIEREYVKGHDFARFALLRDV
jgi:hypothetical protein